MKEDIEIRVMMVVSGWKNEGTIFIIIVVVDVRCGTCSFVGKPRV